MNSSILSVQNQREFKNFFPIHLTDGVYNYIFNVTIQRSAVAFFRQASPTQLAGRLLVEARQGRRWYAGQGLLEHGGQHGGLQALVKSGWPIQKKRIMVAGSGPLLLAVAAELRKQGADDIVVIAGGVIPRQDYQYLYDAGVKCIFGPGTPIADAAIDILAKLGIDAAKADAAE